MYPLFDGLTEADVRESLNSARENRIDAGQTIVREGEIVQALCILKSGA